MRLPARAWRPRAPSRRGRRCRRALCRPPRGRGGGRARGRTPRRSRPPCGKPCPLPPAPLLRAPRRRSCRSPNASEAALASLARRHNATLTTSGAEAAKNAPHPCFSNTSHFNPRSPCEERPRPPQSSSAASGFQSTLPVRGATMAVFAAVRTVGFQPTLPVRGATAIYCVDRVLLSICRPKKSDWPRKTSCKDLKEAECGANLPRDAWEPRVRTADYSAKNPSASYVGFAPTCSIFV